MPIYSRECKSLTGKLVKPVSPAKAGSSISRKPAPLFSGGWFAVKQALKEARLQTPVLTNRNGILRLHEVDK